MAIITNDVEKVDDSEVGTGLAEVSENVAQACVSLGAHLNTRFR